MNDIVPECTCTHGVNDHQPFVLGKLGHITACSIPGCPCTRYDPSR